MEGDDDDHDSEQDEEGEIVNQPDHQNPRGKKGSSPEGGAVPDKTTPQQKRRMQAGSEGHQAVGRKKSESIGREQKTQETQRKDSRSKTGSSSRDGATTANSHKKSRGQGMGEHVADTNTKKSKKSKK